MKREVSLVQFCVAVTILCTTVARTYEMALNQIPMMTPTFQSFPSPEMTFHLMKCIREVW